jgi:hypothetical protein
MYGITTQGNVIFIFTAMGTPKILSVLLHFPSYQVGENIGLNEPNTTRDISVLNYHNLNYISII